MALLALASAGLGACNSLWGIDQLDYRHPGTSQGGSSAGGAGGGAGGSAAGGGTGASGGTGPCQPGATGSCYAGPPGTVNIGACHAGQHACDAQTLQWGPCTGEVVPSSEICGNALDEDCDGHAAAATECLVNEGLLVRYFMDEAASGQAPPALLDAAPEPLALPIAYDTTTALTYCENAGHRGLCWPHTNTNAKAWVPLAGTKIYTALNNVTGGTIELVVDMTGGDFSRLSHVTAASGGDFTLGANGTGLLGFDWQSNTWPAQWNVPLTSIGRVVLQVVLDTTQAVPDDRIKLYLGGVVQTPLQTNPPTQGQAIALEPAGYYVVGNRSTSATSIQGAVYYVAMYSLPLTPAQISTNASMLALDDDSPP
jgi:hypothetical protein